MSIIKIEQPYAWMVVTNQINEVWVDKSQEEELKNGENPFEVLGLPGSPMAWALERYYRLVEVYNVSDSFLQEKQKGIWQCPNIYDRVIGKVNVRYICRDDNVDILHIVFEKNTGIFYNDILKAERQ